MTIAEKLTQIAENEQKVFDAGREMGLSDGHFTGYQDGLAAGKQAQYDAFWDAFQANGERRFYYYAFSWGQFNNGWASEAYNPKYPIIADGTAENSSTAASRSIFHYSSKLTDAKVPIILKNGSAQNCFYRCYALKNIPSLTLENITSFGAAFEECRELETLIVHGKIEADIDIHWSTKLSRESIESIIWALNGVIEGLTCTLSLDAVNKAFETSDGANDGASSDTWEYHTMTGRPNWTFTLI